MGAVSGRWRINCFDAALAISMLRTYQQLSARCTISAQLPICGFLSSRTLLRLAFHVTAMLRLLHIYGRSSVSAGDLRALVTMSILVVPCGRSWALEVATAVE